MGIVRIFTDGAAKGNPGPGGFGIVMKFGAHEKEFSSGFRHTTNNRMELLAVIVALENLKTKKFPVEIYSDSKYVIDSVTKGWVLQWKKKDFKGKKNSDLWIRFLELQHLYQINWHWVKGHNGHPENERCDQLAVQAAEKEPFGVDLFYENENRLN
jgi:ribonuclease HI